MRILPAFLVPYGVIRTDKIMEVLDKQEASGSASIEKVSSILGCVDPRTARKYLRHAHSAIKRASIDLAEKLSHFSGKGIMPSFPPDTSRLECFHSLVTQYNEVQVYLFGGRGYEFQHKPYHFIGINWRHNRANKPSSYVSASMQSSDTS